MTRRAKSVLDHATRNVLLMDLVRRGFNMDPKDPPAAEPPADKKGDKKGDPEPDADKVTLTKAELEAKVNEAAANAVRKANEAAEKKRKDAEDEAARKKAEEQGEYQKLADSEKQKRAAAEQERDAAKLSARKLEVKDKLRDYLAADEAREGYAGVAKYIMPLIEFDLTTDDAEIEKRIKAAADQYITDNPRKAVATPPPGRGPKLPAKPGEKKPEANGEEFEFKNHVARQAF
jgi:hypothetical protein